MFVETEPNVISMRCHNAQIIAGDSIRWEKKTASAGRRYVQPSGSTWDKTLAGKVKFTFNIGTAANYYIFFKMKTNGVKCWLWVDVNGNQTVIGNNALGRVEFNSSTWVWSNALTKTKVTLYAGRNTITLHSISKDLLIEGLVLLRTDNTLITDGTDTEMPVEKYGRFDGFEITAQYGTDASFPLIVYPHNRAKLDGTDHTFRFLVNDLNPTQMIFRLSTVKGGLDIYNSFVALGDPDDITATVTGLEISKEPKIIHGRLFWNIGNGYVFGSMEYQFILYDGEIKQTYGEFITDRTKDKNKVLAIELNNAQGVVRLASKGFVDSRNNEFDDWITAPPYLEQGLGSDGSVGDIEAVNPVLTENWLGKNWRGYRASLYMGDITWDWSRFKLIASANQQGCELVDDRLYSFNVIGDSNKFDRTFHTGADVVKNQTVIDAISYIMGEWNLSGTYKFLNVSDTKLNKQVEYTVTESLTMQDALDTITNSVTIYRRTNQTGNTDFIDPDFNIEPEIILNSDNVIKNTVSIIETIYPVSNVVIGYGDGLSTTIETQATTGNLNESVTIETYLTTLTDAQSLGNARALAYTNLRNVWEFGVIGVDDLVQAGDVVSLQHPMISGLGVVVNVKRQPLFDVSTIEVLI